MIEVSRVGDHEFEVHVKDARGETRHRVTLSQETHQRIGADIEETKCIAAAVRFLLDREDKEQILARFDVTVISRYFPEFERELPKYLAD